MLIRPAPQNPTPRGLPPIADEAAALNALNRVRREYDEMPGLCLTLRQAHRLFAMDVAACERALRTLVSCGYLRVTRSGYVRA